MAKTSVAVLGGGSLGLLLAAKIAASGQEATVWTRSEEQARSLRDNGLALKDADGNLLTRTAVRACSLGEAPSRQEGLIVLNALKQTGLSDSLFGELRRVTAQDAAIVSFCNGIGHIERIAEALPGRPQLAAAATEGALREGPAAVRHTGSGAIWAGQAPRFGGGNADYAPMPTEDRRKDIENILGSAGFSIYLSNNMIERMLRKLLVNSVINPLTALLRIRNGELAATGDRMALMRALHEETRTILHASGLPETEGAASELWEELLDVCARTSRNESSMLQDVRNGRETEIEAINGAVVRLAASRGLPSPRNATVTDLVRAILSG
ncbi:ketopantoate reductase family protein [Cohnella fermenti]|uniref:2-dehydropantoate 2-reductase n=1 Tax=Cohnella fermenti TaxID=2565925 RepID=A0A4S4BLN2_9BACL|nr:2-dehydropantoate 2-reductase [Cohnella fermenti]THF75607.1 2-dehydropantoate 2-reductase [Cohnella fermenti]